ncbi:branched-chain amino acid transaminase [Candidatus Woesearchaeota archaeon]|nr:branched-chain amino acid transaminase [Candidatus Woesearchaeota archaeon]
MRKTRLTWINGKITESGDAKISILSHSLHYGSGIFEGIRFYAAERGPAIFRLREHIDRLFRGAEKIGMAPEYSKQDAIAAIKKLVMSSGLGSGYIRPIFFYGEGPMQVIPKNVPSSLAISVWPLDSYLKSGSVRVAVSGYTRPDCNATDTNVKLSGNYSSSVLAGLEAVRNGFHEALMLDSRGFIAEGTAQNIFFAGGENENIICTPKPGSILPGITRDSVITIAKDLKFKVLEQGLRIRGIGKFSESFFSGTATGIAPISRIGDVTFRGSRGHITKKLKSEFIDAVHGRIGKYGRWLTYV